VPVRTNIGGLLSSKSRHGPRIAFRPFVHRSRASLCFPQCVSLELEPMTTDKSRKLKIGARVCFNGDKADRGKVTAIHANYVSIKWDDGHRSISSHNDMKRIDLLAAKR
jgi:hypothetical protein